LRSPSGLLAQKRGAANSSGDVAPTGDRGNASGVPGTGTGASASARRDGTCPAAEISGFGVAGVIGITAARPRRPSERCASSRSRRASASMCRSAPATVSFARSRPPTSSSRPKSCTSSRAYVTSTSSRARVTSTYNPRRASELVASTYTESTVRPCARYEVVAYA